MDEEALVKGGFVDPDIDEVLVAYALVCRCACVCGYGNVVFISWCECSCWWD